MINILAAKTNQERTICNPFPDLRPYISDWIYENKRVYLFLRYHDKLYNSKQCWDAKLSTLFKLCFQRLAKQKSLDLNYCGFIDLYVTWP